MNKYFLILILFSVVTAVNAQPAGSESPNPRGAFLRSLAVPGWGHHYVDQTNWTRGKYHVGADVILILSFLGLNIHSNNLQQTWFGYSRTEAGIDIENRSRTIRLAVGGFNSLTAYNDFQARTRNWDQFIGDTPENRWNWQSDEDRNKYNDLRNRFENIDQQLPALVGLMIVNRVVSAISAYNRARKTSTKSSDTSFYFSPSHQSSAIVANLKVSF